VFLFVCVIGCTCTQRQGFHQVVVPEEAEAVAEELRESLLEHGVQVVAAQGAGRREAFQTEYAFVPMLQSVLVNSVAHETEDSSGPT
jgi:hypothetical protein